MTQARPVWPRPCDAAETSELRDEARKRRREGVHSDPFTGESTRLATGFAGATNLAIGPDRTIYVAELSAGRISMVSKGKPQAYVNLPGALAVEVSGGHLYASAMAPMDKAGNPIGKGQVVQIRR